MREIYCTYDTHFRTWNVVEDDTCIFYGSIDELEDWLIDHEDEYQEETFYA